ncbi:Rv3654c family TadE-like protein [Gulosibacter bifidus]|uniref:Rv3654c family TadE-like protein n=1 Tax=Gulosibacter bifidus TaxID=272239 RepID=A0ABW5RKB3_9MICO|nr:Rv3654c family TadE-like protein [Gulosibacter bifidus]
MQPRGLGSRRQDERGSGALLAIGIIGAVVALAAVLIVALAVYAAHTRASVAADAAALAAANVASGRIQGDACEVAGRVAAAHGAQLGGCKSQFLESTVTVHVDAGLLTCTATARAGLPAGAVGLEH